MLALLFLLGCGAAGQNGLQPGTKSEVLALSQAIAALDTQIDPAEALLAAELSYSESFRLAQIYQIEDAPLVHNTKVNLGTKPRGLCYHWADDLERRLKKEGFHSIDLHRAVANFDTILIEHSTVIVSARGAGMDQGIVLDPWRKGGRLTWTPTLQDPKYRWIPREEVFRIRRERRAKEAQTFGRR